MSRVSGPLLSIGAAGQIAKTQVYAKWKGLPYVRQYVIPANPQSADQTLTRNAFGFLQRVYQLAPQAFRDPWEAFASGRPLTGRNVLTSSNLPVLREITTLTGMIASPGAKGGISTTTVLTSTATTITSTIDIPDVLPTGWVIVGGVAIAIKDQNPQAPTDYEIFVGTAGGSQCGASPPAPDATPVPVITGLTTATDYKVGSWLIYQRSSKVCDVAYGPSTVQAKSTT